PPRRGPRGPGPRAPRAPRRGAAPSPPGLHRAADRRHDAQLAREHRRGLGELRRELGAERAREPHLEIGAPAPAALVRDLDVRAAEVVDAVERAEVEPPAAAA